MDRRAATVDAIDRDNAQVFELFSSIFGSADAGSAKLPAPILSAAIERAVDGTDPRLRIVSGYSKKLRQGTSHAVEYVIDLIDNLPDPVAVGPSALAGDRALGALFYSAERMRRILAGDPAMKEFRASNRVISGPVTALLAAERSEKRGFGYGRAGDVVVKDVAQTTVSFSGHRLLEPSLSVEETRRLLKRRAFDLLLEVALTLITGRKQERSALVERQALLRSKLGVMGRGTGFTQHTSAADQLQLQERLREIDGQLAGLGPSEEVLAGNLSTVAEVLAAAERHVWLEENLLCLDKFYVLHDKPDASAPPTTFREMHNSEGRSAVVLMVSIPQSAL